MGKRAMVIASRLEPDPHWQFIAGNGGDQPLEILKGVRDGQSAVTLLTEDADQNLMPELGNVDGDQQGRSGRMVGGHSRSPNQCGSCRTTVET